MTKRRDHSAPRTGVTRRGFIGSVGAGAVGAVVLQAPVERPAVDATGDEDLVRITLTVNGRRHRLSVEPRWTLLYVLRDRLGLTGTKPGCERGECGACTVLIDGRPRYACTTLAVESGGREITTIEGLGDGEHLSALQRSFVDHDAFQCGYCTSGQIMAAEGLLRANASPTTEQIRAGMSGNLCRCGAYVHIARAVAAAGPGKGGAR